MTNLRELRQFVMNDTTIDIKAKEQVIGHDWFDHAGAYTQEEEDAIITYKLGYYAALEKLEADKQRNSKFNWKQFGLYLLRWQASSLILAPCIYLLSNFSATLSAVVANLIGGVIFYFIDKHLIFKA